MFISTFVYRAYEWRGIAENETKENRYTKRKAYREWYEA